MKLRLGLIGLGKDWQTRHLPALRLMQDRFEVRAVYSSVSLFADQVARDLRADGDEVQGKDELREVFEDDVGNDMDDGGGRLLEGDGAVGDLAPAL